LKVQPNAVRNEVVGISNGVLRIKVAAPPVKGKANKELITFLSGVLGVSKSSLNLVKGQASRNKVVAVAGLTQKDVIGRLTRET